MTTRPVPAAYRGPWPRISRAVITRDGGLCRIGLPGCTTRATTADHITPLHLGGAAWDMNNLRAACRTCNSKLGAHLRNGTTPSRPSREW